MSNLPLAPSSNPYSPETKKIEQTSDQIRQDDRRDEREWCETKRCVTRWDVTRWNELRWWGSTQSRHEPRPRSVYHNTTTTLMISCSQSAPQGVQLYCWLVRFYSRGSARCGEDNFDEQLPAIIFPVQTDSYHTGRQRETHHTRPGNMMSKLKVQGCAGRVADTDTGSSLEYDILNLSLPPTQSVPFPVKCTTTSVRLCL